MIYPVFLFFRFRAYRSIIIGFTTVRFYFIYLLTNFLPEIVQQSKTDKRVIFFFFVVTSIMDKKRECLRYNGFFLSLFSILSFYCYSVKNNRRKLPPNTYITPSQTWTNFKTFRLFLQLFEIVEYSSFYLVVCGFNFFGFLKMHIKTRFIIKFALLCI